MYKAIYSGEKTPFITIFRCPSSSPQSRCKSQQIPNKKSHLTVRLGLKMECPDLKEEKKETSPLHEKSHPGHYDL